MNKQEILDEIEERIENIDSVTNPFMGFYHGIVNGLRDSKTLVEQLDEPQKVIAQIAEKWHEDIGPVLWWNFPVEEPPYCGTPLDENFPKYKTHFTELHTPDEVEQGPKWVVKVGKLYFCGWEDTTAQFVLNTTLEEGESIIKYEKEGTASLVAKNLGGTVEQVEVAE